MKKLLNKWEILTDEIVELWIIDFFELDEEDVNSGINYYWLGDSIGGVLCFADYFFNMEDIKLCIEKDIDKDKFFEWYYWNLENHPQYINLQSFVWGVAEVKQKEEEQLELLKERVEVAKKELETALANYSKDE